MRFGLHRISSRTCSYVLNLSLKGHLKPFVSPSLGDRFRKHVQCLLLFSPCLIPTCVPSSLSLPVLAQLLPLLHGNVNSSKVIIREFQECCRQGLLSKDTSSPESSSASPPSPGSSRPQTPTTSEDNAVPSKARLKRIISENSVYEKRPDFRMCWYVHSQVLKSFDQEHLPVPCQWSYITMVPSATKEDSGSVPAAGPSQGTPISLKRKSAGSMCITQFMKKRRHDGQVSSGVPKGLRWGQGGPQSFFPIFNKVCFFRAVLDS